MDSKVSARGFARGLPRGLLAEDATASARQAVATLGLTCRRIERLSPPAGGRKSHRLTLRIETDDGGTLKIRCLETEDAASRLVEFRRGLPPAFAPVIARHGTVLIEKWIDGVELSPAAAAARAGEVGAILGSLHAIPATGESGAVAVADVRTQAASDLDALVDARLITRGVGITLQAEILDAPAGDLPLTLVHLDYCPENLVVDPAGALHCVDNEWVRLDARGRDFGRTCARWPVSDDVWRQFMEGYRGAGAADPGPLRFWIIAMTARSAVIRIRKISTGVGVPVARLQELAATSRG